MVATLHAGVSPSGISINRAGTLALVANRGDGTISVFTIHGTRVAPAGTVDLGAPQSGPSHVVFAPDGQSAFVTRNNDDLVSRLSVSGTHVEATGENLPVGPKPYGIEMSPSGDLAFVGTVGAGASGGADEVDVIDVVARPARLLHRVTLGPTAEGIALSADGRHLAVTVMNGTNSPRASPTFHDFGLLKVLRVEDRTLVPAAEAHIGHWCQGAAWSGDSRLVFVQCMADRQILLFRFDGRTLTPAGAIPTTAGPSGIRTAWR